MSLKDQIDLSCLPKHIAIIMDGNGRWAHQHGQHRIFGHEHGVKSVRQVTEACTELGVEYLTLYAFSTENWNRPQPEISALMSLLVSTIHTEFSTLQENNIRLTAIGDLKHLTPECYQELMVAMEETRNNKRLNLILALSYSARWDITEAARKLARQVRDGKLDPEDIDQNKISLSLSTHNVPDPELLIRTSGEYRISNFLLWEIAYTELYYTPVLWPDFSKEHLYEAIINFQNRERRFGMTSEQINLL